MPSTTPRALALKEVTAAFLYLAPDLDLDAEMNSILLLACLHHLLTTERYLNRGREPEDVRNRSIYREGRRMLQLPRQDFRREFRVSKETFIEILNLIEDHPVFDQAPTGHPMAPPALQLAAVLWRMTHDGNGASTYTIGRTFGVSEGTIVNYTDRVFAALLATEPDHTHWPNQSERRSIHQDFAELGVPDGCVGIIDGCHIVLLSRPGVEDAGDFFNRKERYSYNVQGVVGPDKRIRHLHVGHAGSLHDQRVYNNSSFAAHPHLLFSKDKFILADSGYTPSYRVVPVFKKPAGKRLSPEEIAFNKQVSSVRVRVKHAFGILKGRFSSLQGLRVGHTDRVDQARANVWIRCCVLLHNFIRTLNCEPEVEDEWLEPAESQPEEAEDQRDDGDGDIPGRSHNHPRRKRVMDAMGLFDQPDPTPPSQRRRRTRQSDD